MQPDAKLAKLAELLARLCDGKMEDPQWEQLESLLRGDPDAQDFYWRFLVVDSDLEWHVASRSPSLPFGLDATEEPAAPAGAGQQVPSSGGLPGHRRLWPGTTLLRDAGISHDDASVVVAKMV